MKTLIAWFGFLLASPALAEQTHFAVDKDESDDPQAVTDYVVDLYKYYRDAEEKRARRTGGAPRPKRGGRREAEWGVGAYAVAIEGRLGRHGVPGLGRHGHAPTQRSTKMEAYSTSSGRPRVSGDAPPAASKRAFQPLVDVPP